MLKKAKVLSLDSSESTSESISDPASAPISARRMWDAPSKTVVNNFQGQKINQSFEPHFLKLIVISQFLVECKKVQLKVRNLPFIAEMFVISPASYDIYIYICLLSDIR